MIIDVHVHHYSKAYADALRSPSSGLHVWHDGTRDVVFDKGGLVLSLADPMPGPEDHIAEMNALGVDVQVLSMGAPSTYFWTGQQALELSQAVNDELGAIVRRYPDRFRALAILPLTDVDLSLGELDRCVNQLGFSGVLALTNVRGKRIDAPEFDPVWERCNELGLPVLVHPTTSTSDEYAGRGTMALQIGFPCETMMTIVSLLYAGHFNRFPRVKWIFCHAGGGVCGILDRVDNVRRGYVGKRLWGDDPPSQALRQVFFDSVITHVPSLRCVVESLGPGALIFGSDIPHIPGGARPYLEAVRKIGLSAEDEAKVLGGNLVPWFGATKDEGRTTNDERRTTSAH